MVNLAYVKTLHTVYILCIFTLISYKMDFIHLLKLAMVFL